MFCQPQKSGKEALHTIRAREVLQRNNISFRELRIHMVPLKREQTNTVIIFIYTTKEVKSF